MTTNYQYPYIDEEKREMRKKTIFCESQSGFKGNWFFLAPTFLKFPVQIGYLNSVIIPTIGLYLNLVGSQISRLWS